MSENEALIVKRAGCTPFVIFSYIKSNPESNSRLKMAGELNLSVKTVRAAVEKLKDMNLITEETHDKMGSCAWNKKFTINAETEWFQ